MKVIASKKNPIIPLVITVFSMLILYRFVLNPFDFFGLITIGVGVTGIVLYYKNNPKYDRYFYLWVYFQIPCFELFLNDGSKIPLLNAFPGDVLPYDISAGFAMTFKGGTKLSTYINFLPIILYLILKYINAEKPLGRKVLFTRLRKGSFPQISFPVGGKIEKLSGRKQTIAIYQINLENEIKIKDQTYNYVHLEPKNSSLIEPVSKKQVCGLYLCANPDQKFNKKKNLFVDWVSAECF